MNPTPILCLAVGDRGVLDAAAAALPGWTLCRAAGLAEARRALRVQPAPVGLLLFDADPRGEEALDAFLREHWYMLWIAVFHPPALHVPAWRALVHEHCWDFHTWPLDAARLHHTIGHAQGMAALRGAPSGGDGQCGSGTPEAADGPCCAPDAALTGRSAAIVRLRGQIGKVAGASAPVLIWGESGSGKELVAKAVHLHSPRAAGPFVPVNCGAMPASLIQSELFGYERGAFTGAAREKQGLIESAAGGSLFLDEIGDLPMELQANLLRFLQEKTICRVGATRSVEVDVRVIAASHVQLQQAVQRGAFREDLYYRLNVLALDVPPLRDRRDDVAALAGHFFQLYGAERAPRLRGFSSRAMQMLREHDWPGNVRELINRVRRAMVMAEGRLISAADLGLAEPAVQSDGAPLGDARSRAERDAIDASLLRAGRNMTVAARELGVSRMTLYRLLAKHGIAPPSRASQP
ncbi:sigma-54-dependent Fis family transcriptional regulator [Duganella sp. LX20W]|uniref:Sigma-54-dependent Fis family transcriptional regulator n=1 Tax=Rugamonas brunnea TaxID=2758569 RepID=A0A7W2EN52_9BURK|nr:sigma-54 dependent transcriptional regulator [Rugamonas brunnea]MBA5635451.1 sigma-54-dependent Fis family transcriptional regulator [Rugamonas brunnea]